MYMWCDIRLVAELKYLYVHIRGITDGKQIMNVSIVDSFIV